MPRKNTLLIVDDHSHEAFAIAGGAQPWARRHDLALLALTDGDEALQVIKNDTDVAIQIAIVDLWMVDKKTNIENPNKGQEIIRAILAHHPSARVVILSAHMTNEDEALFRKRGMTVFRKPAPPSEVFATVLEDP